VAFQRNNTRRITKIIEREIIQQVKAFKYLRSLSISTLQEEIEQSVINYNRPNGVLKMNLENKYEMTHS
jgi:hypothetical protein